MINIKKKVAITTDNNTIADYTTTSSSVKPKSIDPANLVGEEFGDYIVIDGSKRDGSGHKLWQCICPRCGDSFRTTSYELLKGRKNTVCKNCEKNRTKNNTATTSASATNNPNVVITACNNSITTINENNTNSNEYEACSNLIMVRDLKKDLLDMPVYYHIAHCIPADITFYGDTAKRINEFYNMGEALARDFMDFSGEYKVGTAILINNVFNLIATERKHKRPVMDDLYECVYDMATYCASIGIKYLAMPRIGCGHNKLEWNDVREMIVSTFLEVYDCFDSNLTPINISFCYE